MYLDYTVRPWLLFSFGTLKSFLLVWAKIDCTVHVALIKWPIKQFKPVQRSRQQSQRAYTVLIYILLTGGVVLVLERLTVSKPAYWSPWSFSSNKKTLISIFPIHEISWIADLSIGNLSRDIRIKFWLCHCCIQEVTILGVKTEFYLSFLAEENWTNKLVSNQSLQHLFCLPMVVNY